jgi:hypothetical protein
VIDKKKQKERERNIKLLTYEKQLGRAWRQDTGLRKLHLPQPPPKRRGKEGGKREKRKVFFMVSLNVF